jgi:hypothetical protein
LVGTPAITVRLVVAVVNPVAVAVTIPVPVVVGVNVDVATPPEADTFAAGLNDPVTLVTAKVIALVAVVTVLPFAS